MRRDRLQVGHYWRMRRWTLGLPLWWTDCGVIWGRPLTCQGFITTKAHPSILVKSNGWLPYCNRFDDFAQTAWHHIKRYKSFKHTYLLWQYRWCGVLHRLVQGIASWSGMLNWGGWNKVLESARDIVANEEQCSVFKTRFYRVVGRVQFQHAMLWDGNWTHSHWRPLIIKHDLSADKSITV